MHYHPTLVRRGMNFFAREARFPLKQPFCAAYNEPNFCDGVWRMRKVMLLLLGIVGGTLAAGVLLGAALPGEGGQELSWPHHIEQDDLEILDFFGYDGCYYEDGSGDWVWGVASVLLRNTGRTTLRNGAVRLQQGQEILVFSFTMVPPGEKVLVMEKSRKPFVDKPVTGCWSWALEREEKEQLRVEERGRFGLTVTNLTDCPVASAKIYYKLYDPFREYYIGGYTYSIEVTDLVPGKARRIPAFSYVSGTCRVVG